MQVKATQMGYYQNRRVREGEIFHLEDKAHFSKKWMEKDGDQDDAEPVKPAEPKLSKAEKARLDKLSKEG